MNHVPPWVVVTSTLAWSACVGAAIAYGSFRYLTRRTP